MKSDKTNRLYGRVKLIEVIFVLNLHPAYELINVFIIKCFEKKMSFDYAYKTLGQSQQSSRSAVIETSEEYFNEVLRL